MLLAVSVVRRSELAYNTTDILICQHLFLLFSAFYNSPKFAHKSSRFLAVCIFGELSFLFPQPAVSQWSSKSRVETPGSPPESQFVPIRGHVLITGIQNTHNLRCQSTDLTKPRFRASVGSELQSIGFHGPSSSSFRYRVPAMVAPVCSEAPPPTDTCPVRSTQIEKTIVLPWLPNRWRYGTPCSSEQSHRYTR